MLVTGDDIAVAQNERPVIQTGSERLMGQEIWVVGGI